MGLDYLRYEQAPKTQRCANVPLQKMGYLPSAHVGATPADFANPGAGNFYS